jgi:hypothetical protein
VKPPDNPGQDRVEKASAIFGYKRGRHLWRPILVVGLTPQGCGPEGAADEDMKIVHTLVRSMEGRNTRKILEGDERFNSLSFDTFIRVARCKILVLLGPSAGPLDHQAIDAIAFTHTEGDGKFRL